MSKKPQVITKCVANTYTEDNERIIEYTFPDGTGGLIQFSVVNGENRVTLYRHDKEIRVYQGPANK